MVLRLSMTGGHTCGPEPADGQSIRLPPRLALKAPNRYMACLLSDAGEERRHRLGVPAASHAGALRPPAQATGGPPALRGCGQRLGGWAAPVLPARGRARRPAVRHGMPAGLACSACSAVQAVSWVFILLKI